jgi:hypothetical protein
MPYRALTPLAPVHRIARMDEYKDIVDDTVSLVKKLTIQGKSAEEIAQLTNLDYDMVNGFMIWYKKKVKDVLMSKNQE